MSDVIHHRAGQLPPLVISTAERDGRVILALRGELDLATSDDLRRAIVRAEASGVRELVLDLSDLQFVDSSGIHLIVQFAHRLQTRGPRLSLLRGPEPVHRVFELCRLDRELPFANGPGPGGDGSGAPSGDGAGAA
jgi:anti-sigma B factor antagonist